MSLVLNCSYKDLEKIGKDFGYKYFIKEVDESSLFLVIMR